jgi:hypothetical protein
MSFQYDNGYIVVFNYEGILVYSSMVVKLGGVSYGYLIYVLSV